MDLKRHYRRGGIPRVVIRGTGDFISTGASAIQTVLGVVDREVRNWFEYPLPLSHRFRAYRHGFLSRPYKILELADKDPSEYLSSVEQGKYIWGLNSSYSKILENKVAFHISTEPYVDGVPELFGFVRGGRFDGWNKYERVEDINDDEVFLKPISGGFGEDVHRVPTPEFAPEKFDDRNYLVTEFVKQHSYADEIWPEAANTIRLLTVRDPATGEFFIASAAHRFGVAGNGPRDNWHSGGVAAPVDKEIGELGRLHRYTRERGMERLDEHPDTGTRVTGTMIPDWEKIRKFALSLAELHGQRPWAGWDIVLTDDGPIVLEGNKSPGILLLQLSGGLLTDERVRRFIDSQR